METRQHSALSQTPTDASDAEEANKQLTIQQQMWIDYNALNGIITDNTEDSVDPKTGQVMTIRKMPIAEFAARIGVNRDTLRIWRSTIPNFWERVNQRRKELAPAARLQQIHERWYLNALKMNNWQLTEAWLINFDPDYKSPKLKVEHELGDGLADALNIARERRLKEQNAIEGEVVDGAPDA